MRRCLLVLTPLVLALAVGCGGGARTGETTGSSGSCAAVLRFHGHRYLAHGIHDRDTPHGARIGRGVEPGCSDTAVNGRRARRDPDRRVAVQRVTGVPPAWAVTVEGEDGAIWTTRRCGRHPRCRALLR
jgi:hypothetical protein